MLNPKVTAEAELRHDGLISRAMLADVAASLGVPLEIDRPDESLPFHMRYSVVDLEQRVCSAMWLLGELERRGAAGKAIADAEAYVRECQDHLGLRLQYQAGTVA